MIIKDFELIKQAQKGNMQAFEELLDSWVCPICGVGKDKFEKVT